MAFMKKLKLVTTQEAANLLGISDSRIRQFVQTGDLVPHVLGHQKVQHLFLRQEVKEFKLPLRGRPWPKKNLEKNGRKVGKWD